MKSSRKFERIIKTRKAPSPVPSVRCQIKTQHQLSQTLKSLGTFTNFFLTGDFAVILSLEGGCFACVLDSTSNADILKINKEEGQFIGHALKEGNDDLIIAYSDSIGVGCEKVTLAIESENLPSILSRKTLFFEPAAEFIEFDQQTNFFFIKSMMGSLKAFKKSESAPIFSINLQPKFLSFKCSSEFLIIINDREEISIPTLPLNVYENSGLFVSNFDVVLSKGRELEILEIAREILFLKQYNDELILINMKNYEIRETVDFLTPNILEIYEARRLFLCIYAFGMEIYNFTGIRVRRFSFYSDMTSGLIYFFSVNVGHLILNRKLNPFKLKAFSNMTSHQLVSSPNKRRVLYSPERDPSDYSFGKKHEKSPTLTSKKSPSDPFLQLPEDGSFKNDVTCLSLISLNDSLEPNLIAEIPKANDPLLLISEEGDLIHTLDKNLVLTLYSHF